MLTAAGCRARRDALWQAVNAQAAASGVAAPEILVLARPESLTWLTGFYPSPFVFNSAGWSAGLVLAADGTATLFVDSVVADFADPALAGTVERVFWYDGAVTAGYRPAVAAAAIHQQLARHGKLRLAVEYGATPAGVLLGLGRDMEVVADLDPLLGRLRRVKHADEVDTLRAAIRATDAAHAAIVEQIRPGMREFDAYLLAQRTVIEVLGKQAQVYGDFVVASSGTRHGGHPTAQVIQAGDLLLLDFSVIVNGYRSDFANTLCVGGEPTTAQQAMAQACINALQKSAALLAPGASCAAVAQAVHDHFANVGMSAGFSSHVGHGLGLSHPEAPFIVPKGTESLLVGDVVTIEPSQFQAGVGGMRFEHNYLITPSGFEQLSQHRLGLA